MNIMNVGAIYKTYCNSSGTPSVTLNCYDGTESSLHHCEQGSIENCLCDSDSGTMTHAKIVCKKGMLLYIISFCHG